MFNFIKEYYKMGLYNEADLDIFVSAKMIDETQKQEIMSAL